MSTIDTMYGKHTFRNVSSSVTVYAYPGNSERTYPGKVMEKARQGSRTAASTDGDENNGVWYQNHFEAKEGLILGIHLYSTFNGGVHTDCMLLLRLREDGPLIQVNANLSKNAMAVYDTLPVFTGRADVITSREATKNGVLFNAYVYKTQFDAEEIEEEFEVTTIKKGTPKPKLTRVRMTDGKVRHVEISREPTRKVRIRRS
jgi:hypothetical protein